MKVASDHYVAIDGMLKQDNSIVNDLSAFSYKARVKGCRDVSVLYAYDVEAMELINLCGSISRKQYRCGLLSLFHPE